MSTYQNLLYFLIGILLCIIGLLTLSKVKKSSINISLFLFIVSCIFWLICMYFGYYFVEIQKSNISIYFIRSAFTFGIFCTYFLCIYSYNFPRKNIIVNKHLITFSAILTIILAIIAPFTNLIYMEEIIENNILIGDVVGPLHPIFTLYTLMCIYFIIWILIKKYNKSMGIEKKKIQLILLGITSVVGSVTIFHIILPMFNIYLLQTEVIVFILIFIILAFYSMTKYRFLNISALFLRLSRATIIIGIFSIICISAFNAVKYLFPNIPESINVIISGLIGLNVIKIFEDIIPEFINKSMKEFRNLITEFKAGIGFCENYKSLISSLENIFILKLHIHNIKLILIRDKHSKINMPIFVKNDFSKQLKNNEILVNDEIDFLNISQNKKDIIKVNLKNLEASICLPLFFKNNLIGLFTLGPKSGDEIYSKEEIELVYGLKKKLEICFINILIKRHLQEENDLMKKIINDKTKNLRNQNKENMELLKQQSDFISVTAHEFRTPLSSAIFQVENILDTYNNTGEVFDDISSVGSSLENLKSLTEKLFEVQQIDLNKVKLSLKSINIDKLIRIINSEIQPILDRKKIDFNYTNNIDKKTEIKIDAIMIKQVLTNILSNAIKYSKAKGKIKIYIEESKKEILINIEDNGPGISEKEQNTIFNKFKTINEKGKTGIGLGLFISKKYIQMHNGELKVKNAPSGGAIFTIYLSKT